MTIAINPLYAAFGYIRIVDFAQTQMMRISILYYHQLDKCAVRRKSAMVQGHALGY